MKRLVIFGILILFLVSGVSATTWYYQDNENFGINSIPLDEADGCPYNQAEGYAPGGVQKYDESTYIRNTTPCIGCNKYLEQTTWDPTIGTLTDCTGDGTLKFLL